MKKLQDDLILLTLSLTKDTLDTKVSILDDATKHLDDEANERLNSLLSQVNDLLISSVLMSAATNLADVLKTELPPHAFDMIKDISKDKRDSVISQSKKKAPHLKVVNGKVLK